MLLSDGINKYLWSPTGTLLEQQSLVGAVKTYPATDTIGTVHALTNTTGAVVATRAYDTHGKITNTTGTATSPIGFAGEYTDNESGLNYLRARYYDPTTGQFLSRDPLVAVTRDSYGYAAGNPLLLTDPTGLWGWNPTDWSSENWGVVKDTLGTMAKVTGYVAAAAAVGVFVVGTGGVGGVALVALASYAGGTALVATAGQALIECTDGGSTTDCYVSGGDVAFGALTMGTGQVGMNALTSSAKHLAPTYRRSGLGLSSLSGAAGGATTAGRDLAACLL